MSMVADNLDALSGAAFDGLYDNQIRPELVKFESRRGQAVLIFALSTLTGIVLTGFVVARAWHPALPVICLVGPALLGYLPLSRLQREAKMAVIAALCGPLALTYAAAKFQPPGWDRLLSLHLLPHPDDTSFEDQFTGRRATSEFSICEATLTRGSGKNRSTVFRGQLIKITSPRPFAGSTVVLRDGGWFRRFECPAGLTKVGLEDPQFEKIFEVFGDDQVEARAILTPTFMEALLAIEKALAGNHVRCGFCDGDFLVVIEGPNRFEIGGMFSSLVNRARVERVAGDLRALIQLIDVFLQVRP